MEKLVSGITRFQKTLFEHHKQLFAELAQQQNPEVASRVTAGNIILHGWVYDIELGEIHCNEQPTGTFAPASEH